jgi:hypothetical protein
MILSALLGESVPIRLQLWDGAADRFPLARVYTAAGGLEATLSLAHIALGLYGS